MLAQPLLWSWTYGGATGCVLCVFTYCHCWTKRLAALQWTWFALIHTIKTRQSHCWGKQLDKHSSSFAYKHTSAWALTVQLAAEKAGRKTRAAGLQNRGTNGNKKYVQTHFSVSLNILFHKCGRLAYSEVHTLVGPLIATMSFCSLATSKDVLILCKMF